MQTKMEQFPATNPNPVLSVANDGTILYSNEAGEPLLHEWGVNIGEKLPSYIIDVVHRVISQNSPEKIEIKAGNRVYFVSFHPLPVEECVNIYGFDISEQKELEVKLRESEEQYRAFFENSIDAVFLTSPDGNIYAANPEACRIFGMTEDEIIRAGRKGVVDTSDPRLPSILEERERTGKFKGELNHKRKDGTIFPAEVSTLFFTDRNGVVKISTFIRDITERKRAEETLHEAYENLQAQSEELQAQSEEIQVQNEELQSQSEELHEAYETLRKSEGHYRMLFTNMTDAFYLAETICNKDGKPYDYRYLEINPAYELQTGVKKEQVLGKSALEISPNSSLKAIEKYGEVALSGKSTYFDVFSQIANKYFDIYAFSPEKYKFAVIFRDITERKRAEQERETTVEFLRLVNKSKETADLVHSAVDFFRERSGFEAVGIRLKEGDDYPYFES